jgi:hypothetical protein
LFGGVTITAVVAAEIGIDAEPDVRADRRPGASAIVDARAAGWLSIADSTAVPDVEPLNPGVDSGERTTIALALYWQAAGAQVDRPSERFLRLSRRIDDAYGEWQLGREAGARQDSLGLARQQQLEQQLRSPLP